VIMWKNYKILVLLILLIGCYASKAQMFSYDFATIYGSFDFKFPSILADASFVDVGNMDQPKYKNPENVSKFYRAVILALILIASFLINVPFFLKWAKKQKGSDEVLLYNVEGNFTYLTVLLWIERIEEFNGKFLLRERSEVEKFYNVAKKGKTSIKNYKRKIHDILLIKSFGKNIVRTAFARMDIYTKITYLWDIAIYLSIIYAAVCVLSIDYSWTLSVFVGLFVGNIVAAPVWLICHLIFNHSLKSVARNQIKKGDGIGLRIIMAQLYGGFAGVIWKDLYYIQGRSSWTFGGGSSRKGFLRNIPTATYSSAYSRDEEKKDLDFDKN